MQQNIRNYKRHEQLAQQQEEKLTAADTAIEDLAGQVQAKEERRRQLDRDYAPVSYTHLYC